MSLQKNIIQNGARLPRRSDSIAIVILACLVAWLYWRIPHMGDIWWMDAPRHAMDGAFVLDFVRRMPFRHPVAFAYNYYAQWPALTILFYPPLFSVSLALGYACFGVSAASALLVEVVWLFLLAWGSFRLSRHWLSPAGSLAVALSLIAGPQVFFWGQQIMLDVPAYALIVWSAHFVIAFFKRRTQSSVMIAAILAALAVWTKYNAACFALVLAISFLLVYGPRILRDRAVLRAGLAATLVVVPAVGLFVLFGSYDLRQAYEPGQGLPSPLALFFYYAQVLPKVVSWPVFILAATYVPLAILRPKYRLDRESTLFLCTWIIVMYGFYSSIAVKEPRLIMMIGYPIALAAIIVIDRTFSSWRWKNVIPLCFALTTLAGTIWNVPIPFVSGMRQAALVVAKLAPRDTNVAIWCRYDGTFIFAMRAYSGRPDLGVIPLGKLLFRNVAVSFSRGFARKKLNASQIENKLKNLHVQYVVFQTGYMPHDPEIEQLGLTLHSAGFRKVASIPMHANYKFSPITTLDVYRLKEAVPHSRVAPQMRIWILGGKKI